PPTHRHAALCLGRTSRTARGRDDRARAGDVCPPPEARSGHPEDVGLRTNAGERDGRLASVDLVGYIRGVRSCSRGRRRALALDLLRGEAWCSTGAGDLLARVNHRDPCRYCSRQRDRRRTSARSRAHPTSSCPEDRAMRAIWARAKNEMRAHWRALVALCLLAGLPGGVV